MYSCWLGGDEGVGGWSWGEVGCCAGEEGGDWVGHFFFFFLGGKEGGGIFSCELFWNIVLGYKFGR